MKSHISNQNLNVLAMNTAPAIHIHSSVFEDLRNYFCTLQVPYETGEIAKFLRLHNGAYPHLNREEKIRAQLLVDELITGLQKRNGDVATRIFNVV